MMETFDILMLISVIIGSSKLAIYEFNNDRCNWVRCCTKFICTYICFFLFIYPCRGI